MKLIFRSRVFKIVVVCLGLFLGLRYVYFGSLTRSCIYTEAERDLSGPVVGAKILLHKQAAVVRGLDQEYKCLPQMGKITNKIVETANAQYYKFQVLDSRIDYVDANSQLELTPVKFVEVRKHGLLTMDSGGGPIVHLILQDAAGELYEVALVSLGINPGDEFLKAVKGNEEVVLSSLTKFFY